MHQATTLRTCRSTNMATAALGNTAFCSVSWSTWDAWSLANSASSLEERSTDALIEKMMRTPRVSIAAKHRNVLAAILGSSRRVSHVVTKKLRRSPKQ
jgi:hypothetical protein